MRHPARAPGRTALRGQVGRDRRQCPQDDGHDAEAEKNTHADLHERQSTAEHLGQNGRQESRRDRHGQYHDRQFQHGEDRLHRGSPDTKSHPVERRPHDAREEQASHRGAMGVPRREGRYHGVFKPAERPDAGCTALMFLARHLSASHDLPPVGQEEELVTPDGFVGADHRAQHRRHLAQDDDENGDPDSQGAQFPPIQMCEGCPQESQTKDQGDADEFLSEQLHPELLREAAEKVGYPLRLRMQAGYDHSFFFISLFFLFFLFLFGKGFLYIFSRYNAGNSLDQPLNYIIDRRPINIWF